MKLLRLLVCVAPLAFAGCSTLSAINWSAANPMSWFGSTNTVSEQGLGKIGASTALNEKTIGDILGSDYRLRSGMKSVKGKLVHYIEALKGDDLALVIEGENGSVSRIDVLEADIKTASGVKTGTPFSDLYDKAYGNCLQVTVDEGNAVECKSKESQHISYLFRGQWHGPEGLMPADDVLKNWKLSQISWHR